MVELENILSDLDLSLGEMLAFGLAAIGILLLLASYAMDGRRGRPNSTPGPKLVPVVGAKPQRSRVGKMIEFVAPVVAPAIVWFGLRLLSGVNALPALAGLMTFIFARRIVVWVELLPWTLRAGRIERGLSDMLEMMLLCAQSGLGVDQMLARVELHLRPLHPELSGELGRLRHQIGLLADRSAGYRHVAETTPSEALRGIIVILDRTERTGTELGPMLKILLGELQLQMERRGEAVAQRLPVYLVVVLVLLFMPAILLILVGPSYIRLLDVLRGIAQDAGKF
ncbi:MAG: type II secretion system F family protein [Acetobacteraceae bacterium]|nr:type II secretion system F family protein [Acetobacteraceae bacterium]